MKITQKQTCGLCVDYNQNSITRLALSGMGIDHWTQVEDEHADDQNHPLWI